MVNRFVTTVLSGTLLVGVLGNGIAEEPAHLTATSRIALATADREELFREFQARLKSLSAPVVSSAPRVSKTTGKPGEVKLALANSDHQLFADFDWFRGPVPAAVAAPAVPLPTAVAPPAPTPATPAAQPTCDDVSPTGHFEIGDNIKLVFYEYVADQEKDKWGKKSGIGFEQITELSGEYTAQEDGTIAVPLLGLFDVHNRSAKDLQSDLAAAFEKVLVRKGFVTVRSNERPPIYVLGPVKTPGSFKYSPGMTVFHAMALAGGYNQPSEPWQQMDAVREATKRNSALEEMSDLLVRKVVLKSERDQVAPDAPQQLVALVGETKAKGLIAAESSRRLAIVSARQTRERLLAESIDAAKQNVQMLTNSLPSEELARSLKERISALQAMLTKGWVARTSVLQVQGQLAEAEQRRQDAMTRLTEAKQRLASVEQDKARLDADTRSELDTAINTVEQQIAGVGRDADSSSGVLSALKVRYGASSEASKFSYQIVRQSAKGPVEFAARGMTPLYPGDLVRIVTPEDGQNPATAPEKVTQPGFKNASFGCK